MPLMIPPPMKRVSLWRKMIMGEMVCPCHWVSLCMIVHLCRLWAGTTKGNELSEALANILLGKKRKFEKVNIAEKLDALGLKPHFPDELWAQTSAVRVAILCFPLHVCSVLLLSRLASLRQRLSWL